MSGLPNKTPVKRNHGYITRRHVLWHGRDNFKCYCSKQTIL